ncbi:hypothetical protein K9F62_11315 [Desulfovibrio sp. JY]|nr:hypothetical protein K9F62_11315 [Desulfovibrio sp. JY]
MMRIIKISVGTIYAILIALYSISPKNIDNFSAGFGLFLIREFFIDITVLLLILATSYLVFFISSRFISQNNLTIRDVFLLTQNKFFLFVSLFLLLLCLAIPVYLASSISPKVEDTIINRIRYLKNESAYDFRYMLLNDAVDYQCTCQYDNAIKWYTKVLTYFPDHISINKWIKDKIKEITNRINYANTLISLSDELEKKKGCMDRNSIFLLAEAIRITPANKNLQQIFETKVNKLNDLMSVAEEYYLSCINKKYDNASQLLKKYSWFLFGDELLLFATNESDIFFSEESNRSCLSLIKHTSLINFKKLIGDSWELKILNSAVNQKNNLVCSCNDSSPEYNMSESLTLENDRQRLFYNDEKEDTE